MAQVPTYQEVKQECVFIDTYVASDTTMAKYTARALADVKRYLLNSRGVLWSKVYSSTTGDYIPNSDGEENNKDQLLKAIRLMTIALIFKDNAQGVSDSPYWDQYLEYRRDAEIHIDTARIDIDTSEDGSISQDEERSTGQVFFKS